MNVEALPLSLAISVRSGTRKNGIWSSPPTKTMYFSDGRVRRIEFTVAAIPLATAFASSGAHGFASQAV